MSKISQLKPAYIIGVNLLVFVIYSVWIKLLKGDAKGEDAWGSGLALIFFVFLQLVLCFILSAAGNSGIGC